MKLAFMATTRPPTATDGHHHQAVGCRFEGGLNDPGVVGVRRGRQWWGHGGAIGVQCGTNDQTAQLRNPQKA
jgi:hypothetical protein